MITFDSCQRFFCAEQNWRGEIVRLQQSYQNIMQQHGYPQPIWLLLGQALLAVTLITNTMKFSGQLTVQFQSDEGAIEMLVAKCNQDLQIRGLAQWQPEATAEELAQGLHDGKLIFTLEQANGEPYQSIVALERGTIANALQKYFLQSEQLPTLFHFAIDAEQAVGVMLQKLPTAEELPVNWPQLQQHLQGVTEQELLTMTNAELIKKLQQEHDVHLYPEREVTFFCPCTIERMQRALILMGKSEVTQILEGKQEVLVTCEYCNHSYGFSKEEIERIFSDSP